MSERSDLKAPGGGVSSGGRRFLKQLVAGFIFYSGLFRLILALRRSKNGTCVLCFHRVLPGARVTEASSQNSIIVSSENFALFLKLVQRWFRVSTLSELFQDNLKLDAPRCVITFDDGWADNFEHAFPVLSELHLPATIFLVTSMIGSNETFWVEQFLRAWKSKDIGAKQTLKQRLGVDLGNDNVEDLVEALKGLCAQERKRVLSEWIEKTCASGSDRMLNWQEVNSMARGGIDFQSHTHTHPILTVESAETVVEELEDSRTAIKAQLGREARAFAYPNGAFNDTVRNFVQSVGYECAFSTQAGWYFPRDDRYTISRVLIQDDNFIGSNGKFSPALAAFTVIGWR